ncbi:RHS repeat domain-containing protein [Pseudoalteromonas aurantia]|uniref:Teneurin-like YD-shell domain-containing protein n=1 Tax=Pseudoalteromonas aurantia 208 TaxID=1314867 RepID=A0ABR9EFP3_9GAMM|nr:RHS repeat-associated core domain-containing protein [Pseudoalteromonas aurantia]MBE0368568.1 hypothetical protein [Pseudoalteromonas aurantia 208]
MLKLGLVLLFLTSHIAFSSNESSVPDNNYEEHISQVESSVEAKLFGEYYDINTGKVSFKQTDIDIKGNSSLEVAIRRKFSNQGGYGATREFGDWSLDVPYIRINDLWARGRKNYYNVSENYNFCLQKFATSFISIGEGGGANRPVSSFNNSAFLYIPEEGEFSILDTEQNIIKDFSEFDQNYSSKTTKNGHHFNCFTPSSGPGIGIKVKSPNGKVYYFSKPKIIFNAYHNRRYLDHKSGTRWTDVSVYLMVTRIEDGFGNYVNYNYDQPDTGENVYNRPPDDNQLILSSIAAKDGRKITLKYETVRKKGSVGDAGYNLRQRVKSVTVNGKEWSYEYDSFTSHFDKFSLENFDNLNFYSLSEVVNPNKTKWKFIGLTPQNVITYNDNTGNSGHIDKSFHPIFKAAISPAGFVDTLMGGLSSETTKNNKLTGIPDYTATIISPSGAEANYTFRSTHHGISGSEKAYFHKYCNLSLSTLIDILQSCKGWNTLDESRFFRNYKYDVWSLIKKQIDTLDGKYEWTYAYSENVVPAWDIFQGFLPSAHQSILDMYKTNYTAEGLPGSIKGDDVYNYKVTKVTNEQTGLRVEYVINRDFSSHMDGKVILKNSYNKEGELIRKEDYGYKQLRKVGSSGRRFSNEYNVEWQTPLFRKSIINISSDGVEDVHRYNYSDFDALANPELIIKTSNEKTIYEKRELINSKGETVNKFGLLGNSWLSHERDENFVFFKGYDYKLVNEYPSRVLVRSNYYKYNSLNPIYTYVDYHADGNVEKIEYNKKSTFGNGNFFVKYSEYSRGLAQSVTVREPNSDDEMLELKVVDYNGFITSVTDFNGVNKRFDYDEMGRLLAVDLTDDKKYGSNLDTLYEWNDLLNTRTISKCTLDDARTACTDNATFRVTEYYDALLRLKSKKLEDLVNTNDANSVRYQYFDYDHNNKQTFASHITNSSAKITNGVSTKYDALGRVKKVSTTGMGDVRYEYLAGNKIKVTDAQGNATTTTYQAFGSPSYEIATKIESPENITTDIDVDIFGLVKSITQSGEQETFTETRTYDANKQLCLIQRADVGNTVMKYDALGGLQWQKQGVTNTECVTEKPTDSTSFIYDNVGDLYKIDYPGTDIDVEYTRDNNGNIKKLVAGTVTHAYNYNNQNLLEDETLTVGSDGTLTIDYDYNNLGHRSAITYPDNTKVQFKPNGFGEPTEAQVYDASDVVQQSFAIDAIYYAHGALNTFTYGNGVKHTTTVNTSSLLPESIVDLQGTTNIVNLGYTYDNNLNITSITDTQNPQFSITNMTYDGVDRLKTVTGVAGIGNSAITYDTLGNIKTYSSKDRDLTYKYDTSLNRLTSVTGTGTDGKYADIKYDARGHIKHNGKFDLNFNAANQLKSAKGNTYFYDGHNRRVKQVDGKGTSYSMYSQDGTLLYREKGSFIGEGTSYIHLGKKLIAKYGDVTPQTVAESRQHHRPFGESIEAPKDDVGYTGHKFDTDLGLSYMQARYYDPVIGRFMSNDPVGYTAANPVMSFNRYMYVNNNPYKYNDPDGEFFNLALGAIGATVGAISGGVSSYVSSGGDWGATATGAGIGAAIGATAGLTGGASLVAGGKAAEISVKTATAGRALATMGNTSLKTGAVSAASNAAGQVVGHDGDLSKVSGTQIAVAGAAGLAPGLVGGAILEATGTASVASVSGMATATVVSDAINTVTQIVGSEIAKDLEED